MKKNIVTLFLVLFAVQIQAQESKIIENLNSIVSAIKDKYAPDKRVALWDVDVNQEGENINLSGETNIVEAFEELENKTIKSYLRTFQILIIKKK